MRSLAIFLILLFGSRSFAQIEISYVQAKSLVGVTAPRLVGDRILVGDDSKPSVSQVAIISVKTPAKFVTLKARKSLFESAQLTKISDTEWILSGEGRWKVEATSFDPDRGIDEAAVEIVIGPRPGPTPDPEPDPKPDPTPEPPKDLPIAGDGFRVLITYESADMATYPEAQKQVMYSQEVRSYLSSKCVAVAGTPEWRVLDKDSDMTNTSKIWQDAMKRPKPSIPWIQITNGKEGFEGPLPKSTAEALTLLRKYGGQ